MFFLDRESISSYSDPMLSSDLMDLEQQKAERQNEGQIQKGRDALYRISYTHF